MVVSTVRAIRVSEENIRIVEDVKSEDEMFCDSNHNFYLNYYVKRKSKDRGIFI